MANVSTSISIPNEEFSDDTTPSVARKFLNEVKSTIVTLQRVVKHRMTLETHNWSSSAYQELHKIIKDENFPIVNQVDARVQKFEIQFLKEVAKFVGDFKSLEKEADESLAKHKALELEIERLMSSCFCLKGQHTWYKYKYYVCKAINLGKPIQGMFRIHPFKTSREEKHVPNNVRASVRTTSIIVLQPIVFTKKDVNSDSNSLSSTGLDNTKTRRPQPRSNTKNDRVPSMSTSSCNKNKRVKVEEHHRNLLLSKNNKHMSSACNNIKLDSQNVISKVVCAMCKQCLISVNHDVCLCNYANGKTSHGKKQKANVSIKEKQKKQQPKVKKTKKVRFIERLATPKPSKPRFFLRWSPTGRLFDLTGKIIASSESESQSDCSNGNLKLLINFVWKFLGTVRFGNDHGAAILGFGDLQWRNILITRVYFVEGLGHNLFSVGQFYDSNLEVAFRRNKCFVRNLEGVDLLKGIENTKTKRPQPRSNTKNDRVPYVSKSSRSKNKDAEVEEHHRNLLLSKNIKHMSSECKNIKHDNQNVISKVVCAMCKQCLFSVNHDVCLCNYVNGKNSRGKKQKANVSIKEKQKKHQPHVKKPKKVGFIKRLATPKLRKPRFLLRWSPTGRLFDQKGKIVDSSEFESQCDCSNGDNTCTSNTLEPKIKRFPNFTSLLGRLSRFVYGTIRFENDHVAVIMGFGDLQWGNILITRVYFIKGLGHNLFSVGQFCDSNLEVAFRRNACFVRNLKGVDLLKGDCSTNLYIINLHEMAYASPICLMARASSTKSWLWHQRLSHLNFDTINDLARNDLLSCLPKFKYNKEHLCPSCEKRYVLVIVDDYSRYTWVHFLRSKDEAPEVIKTFLKRIIVLLQSPVIIIRTDNDTEFKNQVLKEYFDPVGISRQMTKKIMETMNVSFDELLAMAFEQRSSKPRLQSMTSGQISSGLDLTYAPSTITTQQPSEGELDLLFEAMYDDYIGGQQSATARTVTAI
nr:hypothetical protein [Tanacetum cinerariifolium]